MLDTPLLPLPCLDDLNRHFWTSGETGRLEILRCQCCSQWIHPPTSACPECLSPELAPEPVSGNATVEAFTTNFQQWAPGQEVPYTLAIVSLKEEAGVRLTTRLVGVAPESVRIGLPVRVRFEQREDVWLPMFSPA